MVSASQRRRRLLLWAVAVVAGGCAGEPIGVRCVVVENGGIQVSPRPNRDGCICAEDLPDVDACRVIDPLPFGPACLCDDNPADWGCVTKISLDDDDGTHPLAFADGFEAQLDHHERNGPGSLVVTCGDDAVRVDVPEASTGSVQAHFEDDSGAPVDEVATATVVVVEPKENPAGHSRAICTGIVDDPGGPETCCDATDAVAVEKLGSEDTDAMVARDFVHVSRTETDAVRVDVVSALRSTCLVDCP